MKANLKIMFGRKVVATGELILEASFVNSENYQDRSTPWSSPEELVFQIEQAINANTPIRCHASIESDEND